MSNDYFNFFIDEKTVAEINTNSKGFLARPTEEQNETLYVKSESEAKWRELLEVRDTSYRMSDDEKNAIFTVQFRVHQDGYAQPNRGRVITMNYWISQEGLQDSDSPDHKKAIMNMTKLMGLLKVCGITLEKNSEGKYDIAQYFKGEKPMVGQVFWGIIRDYVYIPRNSTDKTPTPGQDIDKFIKADN